MLLSSITTIRSIPEALSTFIGCGGTFSTRTAPRSSTFKRWGILQANSVGVIDNSYCGTNDEWKLPVYATRDTVIEKGDRICQFRIFEVQPAIEFEECETLSDTDRGGFGSSGRK